jgi:hypothetical protein
MIAVDFQTSTKSIKSFYFSLEGYEVPFSVTTFADGSGRIGIKL